MSDALPPDLGPTERYIANLSHQVDLDLRHKARLREELLRRYQELPTESPRAVGKLWPRLAGLKRLTLVAPPALAGAMVLIAVLILQTLGQQGPQTAEAARISAAAARTVPTVTSWSVTVHQVTGESAASYECVPRKGERLFIRNGQVYLYIDGSWYQIPPTSRCPSDWQWAFATFAARLPQYKAVVIGEKRIDGVLTTGFLYHRALPHQRRVTVLAWVERSSGLVVHLERVVKQGTRVVERSSADYHYQRTP